MWPDASASPTVSHSSPSYLLFSHSALSYGFQTFPLPHLWLSSSLWCQSSIARRWPQQRRFSSFPLHHLHAPSLLWSICSLTTRLLSLFSCECTSSARFSFASFWNCLIFSLICFFTFEHSAFDLPPFSDRSEISWHFFEPLNALLFILCILNYVQKVFFFLCT